MRGTYLGDADGFIVRKLAIEGRHLFPDRSAVME
jgi:hypothetical protein